jgi:hypothetical protein
VLTYSIYEDGGTTGLAEDVDMTPASPFDGVVGFYLARPQLTAAAGFEKGKNYTVLVKATVDSVATITAHTFQIEAEVDSNSVSGTVATVTTLTNLPAIPTDWLTAAGVKADAVTKIQTDLALEATLATVDGIVDSILEDTGTTLDGKLDTIDGIVDDILEDTGDNGVVVADDGISSTSIANSAITSAMFATDAIKADAIKADAVTKIQSGLATAAALETIDNFLDTEVAAILADTNELQTDLADGGRLDLLIDSILEDTGTTLPATLETIDNFLDTEVAAILADTNELQTDWVNGGRLDLIVDAINTETASHPTAGEIWAHSERTLTYPAGSSTVPEIGDPVEIYRDTTVIYNFEGIGDISAYDDTTNDKIWITFKTNLDQLDSQALIQILALGPGAESPGVDTLLYINRTDVSTSNPDDGTLVFTDKVAGNGTMRLEAAVASLLPIITEFDIYFDIKGLLHDTGVVTRLSTGTAEIIGTSTRTIT